MQYYRLINHFIANKVMSKEQHMDMQEEELANQQTGLSLELEELETIKTEENE